MERYICIHAHFYQPPRENPWLEAVEIQDSARPYHDWNERITAECYAPNAASRILDERGRISDIASNYSRISFNFGATLLSWMEKYAPDVYGAVLKADRQSVKLRSGHGNAIAQVYNHMIMPLADSRDKRTQVKWGLRDFEDRFKRPAEGMWLAETAVDLETLNILAEHGIKYTILAPRQAAKVRKLGGGRWKDVSGAIIDPARAYLCKLKSGRKISIFFYDGPISQAVAFEKILDRGEDFVNRLLSGFTDARKWPQLLHIATDGETYGHHHTFGDMALAYALSYIESNGLATLTNYGEYLEKHPPAHEVQIFENSSWSCIHGIERWKSNCGCNSGGRPGWDQEWRGPLRDSLDWLRGQLAFRFEHKAKQYMENPWKARDDFIEVLLDRSEENVDAYFRRHAKKELSRDEKVLLLKLFEMQRHAMLMYTSCGWFFDELSGIETVQVLQYAGRAAQLSEDIMKDNLETVFVKRLSAAKSNLPEHENGALIYKKFVKPAIIDLKKVAAHYAVSSVFEEYNNETGIFSYTARTEDYRKIGAGMAALAVGRVTVSSNITWDFEDISFSVLHLGGHAVNGGVGAYFGESLYRTMKEEMVRAFEKGSFADIIRLMDQHFGTHNYSLINLFRDRQRKILNLLIAETIEGFVRTYTSIYDTNRILMGFILEEASMPVPKAFQSAAELALNSNLMKAFSEDELDVDRIQGLIRDIRRWNIPVDSADIEFAVRRKFESMMDKLHIQPSDLNCLLEVEKVMEMIKLMPVGINYWHMQNIYYGAAETFYRDISLKAKGGDKEALRCEGIFKYVGELLNFNVSAILKEV
jgi:alpha-amylase/alpha-mannosidase (GH57 family)